MMPDRYYHVEMNERSELRTCETVDDVVNLWKYYISMVPTERDLYRYQLLLEFNNMIIHTPTATVRDIIIALSKECHGADYEYDNIYITPLTKITNRITPFCHRHGLFAVSILAHLLPPIGSDIPMGCIACAREGHLLSAADIIEMEDMGC